MKLDNKVYSKAAEILEGGRLTDFACHAIRYAAPRLGESGFLHKEAFIALFFPPEKIAKEYEPEDAWGDLWGKDSQDCRVLALLFMSEIAKGE